MKTLIEVEKIIKNLADNINAPKNLLPSFDLPHGDGTPYIEIDNFGNYYFIISERGVECERKRSQNLDELLYWIFDSITFSIACDYEIRNRIEKQDFRRILFAKQEELLSILNKDWEEKKRKEHIFILRTNPFDDNKL